MNVGIFYFSDYLMESGMKEIADIYSKYRIVPIRTEHMYHLNRFVVTAYSDMLFKEVAEGHIIPHYTLVTQFLDGKLSGIIATESDEGFGELKVHMDLTKKPVHD